MNIDTIYVLDTSAILDNPAAIHDFSPDTVVIPYTVLEELDRIKQGKSAAAKNARWAIRSLDASMQSTGAIPCETGYRCRLRTGRKGDLIIASPSFGSDTSKLDQSVNDNQIVAIAQALKGHHPQSRIVLKSNDIAMRVKAKALGLEAEELDKPKDHEDQLPLHTGVCRIPGSLFDHIRYTNCERTTSGTVYKIPWTDFLDDVAVHDYIIDGDGDVWIVSHLDYGRSAILRVVYEAELMKQNASKLKPKDLTQAMAMRHLLDDEIPLVMLSGPAGSGKTLLAVAAAMEQVVKSNLYDRIIVTRSLQGLDEDIGALPGTEQEKIAPWCQAIYDAVDVLDDLAGTSAPINHEHILQFNAPHFMRGRSFQRSLILIEECQNLTLQQMKALLSRAGPGSKIIATGSTSQIDNPKLTPQSCGFSRAIYRLRKTPTVAHIHLDTIPRSKLARAVEELL